MKIYVVMREIEHIEYDSNTNSESSSYDHEPALAFTKEEDAKACCAKDANNLTYKEIILVGELNDTTT